MERKHVFASAMVTLVGAASIANADPTTNGNYVETSPYTYVFISGTPIQDAPRPTVEGFGATTTPYVRTPPTPSWYELGVVASRFDRVDSKATGSGSINTRGVRFSLAAGLSKHLYVGADAEFGKVGEDLSQAGDPVAGRSTTSTTSTPDTAGGPVSGEYGIARVVAGTSVDAGVLHFGGELAAGVRYADYGTAQAAVLGVDLTSQTDALFEARGRVDAWITPRVTLGAVAGVDLRNHDDVSLCVALGLRFSNRER